MIALRCEDVAALCAPTSTLADDATFDPSTLEAAAAHVADCVVCRGDFGPDVALLSALRDLPSAPVGTTPPRLRAPSQRERRSRLATAIVVCLAALAFVVVARVVFGRADDAGRATGAAAAPLSEPEASAPRTPSSPSARTETPPPSPPPFFGATYVVQSVEIARSEVDGVHVRESVRVAPVRVARSEERSAR